MKIIPLLRIIGFKMNYVCKHYLKRNVKFPFTFLILYTKYFFFQGGYLESFDNIASQFCSFFPMYSVAIPNVRGAKVTFCQPH